MRVYLDNAATTPMDPLVYEEMGPYFLQHFGNPSSIHGHGREARAAVEKARKKVAQLLNTSPAEVFFTSCGTEADNTAIFSAIKAYNIKHAIASPIEHHAVLHPLQNLEKAGVLKLSYVELDEKGNVKMGHLDELLKQNSRSLVSLMHANNEVGNITNLNEAGEICASHDAIFHADTVQTVSHIPIDLQSTKVDFITGSAHKFHGPKGVGFLYINGDIKIPPFIYGGAQERNMRGGTENVAGIMGLAKALELAYERMEEDKKHILGLKSLMIKGLREKFTDLEFNGESENLDKSLYTVLSASLPESEDNEMLLFNLDIKGISASGGSACTSGSVIGSHVLQGLNVNPARGHIRFSFSRNNTEEEVRYVIDEVAEIFRR